MSPVPAVGHDDEGQVVFLGECRVHGWHGHRFCPYCPRVQKPVKHLEPLNARYRPGNEIVAFGLPRRRFWTDGAKVDREAHCRMCRRHKTVRPLTRHHVIPQEWWRMQGDEIAALRNAAANVVGLCRVCHDHVEVEDDTGRRMLRNVLAQDEIAFVIDVIGRDWLDERYPSR